MSQSIDEVLLGTPARGVGGDEEGEGEGDKFVRQLFESLLLGTRASNAIPDGEGQEDYAYNATFPEFRSRAEGCGKQVLEVIQIFLNHVRQEGELELGLPEVGDAGDPEVFQGIAEVVETLLEDVDSYLDEASGKGANQQVALMRHQLRTVASAARSGPAKYASMVANVVDIPKPQEAFTEEIDNSRDTPFVPRLREKPNAVQPLDLAPISTLSTSMGMELESRGDDSILGSDALDFHYPHPYEVEVRTFHYLPAQVQAPDASQLVRPAHLEADEDSGDNTDCAPAATFVDTVEALEAMISDILGDRRGRAAGGGSSSSGSDDEDEEGGGGGGGDRRACREIAVDLEHHSFRTFQGVVCLVQLSTRERDYIVDPLKLRGEMGRLLPIFSDPTIVKVLHGSDSDILWLQRDFGLYIVNMFDTGQAARQLGLPSFGLAHLLETFCDFTADKKHQLSDWRMRPLPADMLKYAQSDTHYLLYVYDRLRVDLERSGGDVAVKGVLDASREICLRRYEKPLFRERGWSAVLRRQGGNGLEEGFGEVPRRVLSALWDWRDSIARAEDESCGYVMSVYVMIRMARKCPSNRDELEGCGNPLPRLVQQHAEDILAIVENGKNNTENSTDPASATTPLNPRTPLGAGTRPTSAAPPPSGGVGSSGTRLGASSESGFGDAGSSSIGRSSATTFNPVSSAEPYFRTFNVTPSSVSQFVMAEASRGSPSPLLTHQSPVLNTEELYRAAGWMTPLPKDRSSSNKDTGGGGGGGDSDDDEVMTDATAGGRSSAAPGRLAVLSAKNEQHDTSQRMAHSLPLGGSSGGGGGAAAAATAAGVAAKEAEAAAAAAAADAGVKTADRIRDEIAQEPVLSLANLAGFGGEPGAGGGSDGESGSSSGDGADPGEEDAAEEPGIPKSIAEIYEISNRNRRRNKEKKKLRETARGASNSPSRTQQQQLPQQQPPPPGIRSGGDSTTAAAAASSTSAATAPGGGAAEQGPAANYFSGRKRQKGEAGGGQQGLGLLLDRGRGPGDGKGGADDTVEFMEDLGWLSVEQREAMTRQGSPAGGPSSSSAGGPGNEGAPHFDPMSGANGIGSSTTDGLIGGGEQGDGYSRARPRGAGSARGQGPAGRIGSGGGGRGKGGVTPNKRDRDGGRGGVDGGRGGGAQQQQQPAFRGYDFSQAPPSMGAFQREGNGGGRGGGGGSGVFNPFLAGPAASAGGQGGGAGGPTGSAQGAYGGGRQPQQQQQHWRPRPDTEKAKSMTYGAQSMPGVGQGRGGGGGNGQRRGR